MKRILPLLVLLTLLTGCLSPKANFKKFEATFLTLFDTVTTVVGYAETEGEFQKTVEQLHGLLTQYHQLYDIYNPYPGVVNLYTLNHNAGGAPLVVDDKIMDLLVFSKDAYAITGGAVNVFMGSVLALWHASREAGIANPQTAELPNMQALSAAALHSNPDDLILDIAASTAQLRDTQLRLDVGAIAKGYAVEQVCLTLEAQGVTNLLLSVGGNVRAIGSKPDGTPWTVGIENPENPTGDYLTKVLAENTAVVTSGSYQRYFTVDGKAYHHIIDQKTLLPAQYMVGVSVICPDSGWADVLSTALFSMTQSDGQALLAQVNAAQAIWVLPDGSKIQSPGFGKLVKP